MKRKTETVRQNPSERYFSPSADVIKVNVSRVLCQSEREIEKNTTEMREGGENW